jgi:hypothetical protein
MRNPILALTLLIMFSFYCQADGIVVDKVYHPYVVASGA